MARRWLGLAGCMVGLELGLARVGLGSWLGRESWLGLGLRLGLGPRMGLGLALGFACASSMLPVLRTIAVGPWAPEMSLSKTTCQCTLR